MGNKIFIKIILTVIAVELGVLVFKNNTTNVVMSDANANGKVAAVQAKFDMPNATNYENQQTPMKVEIVGINIGTGNTKNFLPVRLFAYSSNQQGYIAVPYPFSVYTKPAQ